MGSGGRSSAAKERPRHEKDANGGGSTCRAPSEKPPFTVGQLRKAIPPHCFERSVLRSFSYVARDLLLSSLLLYSALAVIPALPPPSASSSRGPSTGSSRAASSPASGSSPTSAATTPSPTPPSSTTPSAWSSTPRSSSPILLEVQPPPPPLQHRLHGAGRGLRPQAQVLPPLVLQAPPTTPSAASRRSSSPSPGWPLYLAFNVSGRPYPRFACHYDPNSPIYTDRERLQVLVSDAGVLAALYALYRLSAAFSLGWVARVYGAPLLVVNGWLVLITYLQHTHPALPHYDSSEWDWLRGALSTVDRDYGGAQRGVPQHHRHPRRAPPLLGDAALPRGGGDRGDQAGARGVLQLRRHAGVQGPVEGGEGVRVRRAGEEGGR
ncbi:delta(12)-fatty-acid desaturase FAD2-like [Iris pallida]|uniref:Delta(12)-fatty-acid desaturase FAD2-like n=1 Tax=Iris pallida TaxID=29817 RepID=A0AAX6GKI8_IRIPA|nr:delta(12)-fatty-acid desaturase FAD2-like [Iris pallida]